MRRRVEQVWRFRWFVLCCAKAKAFVVSLLELRPVWGSDREAPLSHEVVGDFCCAGCGGLVVE